VFELLERRVLLTGTAPEVTRVTADNRGDVSIYFNEALNPATVGTGSVLMFTAGTDGNLNTADDVNAGATVTYDSTNERIQISANLTANTPYWVEVLSTVQDESGNALLGTYTGTFPTTTAGTFRFEANPASTDNIAQFTIDGQDFDVQLYDSQTNFTASIPNFLSFVNSGAYDETFIHRSTNTNNGNTFNIIQGGGYAVENEAITNINPTPAPIAQEPIFSNIAGSLAMANTGAATSTSNQWYFNVSDNTAVFDPNYSVIGQIIGSQAVIQTVNAFTTVDLGGTALDPNDSPGSGPFADLPVTDPTVTNTTLSPSDLVVVNRVSILEVVSALPQFGVAPTVFVSGAPAVAAVAQTPAATFSNSPITPDSSNSLLENSPSNNLLD
jgi:cyclophilin family peptidyl-prolyl cis-trans isomerase